MNEADGVSRWEKLEWLGGGGNGVVWRARSHGEECALKVLKETKPNTESYRRFAHEIQILRELNDQPGVLPILDAHLPDTPSKSDRAWLVMPLATGIKKALGERPPLAGVVEAVASIAGTLAALGDRGICHRDIKPENLYRYLDSWVIGDFGLADFPGKEPVTDEGRALGPRFYIAPEMVRDPVSASGFPADVWSLAKTMWVLATGQNYPPPGPQPSDDSRDCLAVITMHPRAHLLDRLIERATRTDPSERPSMREFARELDAWLALRAAPPLPADVSDLANMIRIASKPHREASDLLQRSREEACRLSHRLLAQLESLGNQLAATGLSYNPPSESGVNLLPTSGFDRADLGEYGGTVSIYTPPPAAQVYDCGIMVQVLNDGRHRLYAAHRIGLQGQPAEVCWHESYEVEAGTSTEEQAVNLLLAGLHGNLRLGLARFLEVLGESRT